MKKLDFTLYDDYNIDDNTIAEAFEKSLDDINDYDGQLYYDMIADDLNRDLADLDKYNKYVIYGELGLWNRTSKVARVIDSLADILNCFQDYNILKYNNGVLSLNAIHHDGTNNFTIKALSARGERYIINHSYDMPDLDLAQKIATTRGLTRKIQYTL